MNFHSCTCRFYESKDAWTELIHSTYVYLDLHLCACCACESKDACN